MSAVGADADLLARIEEHFDASPRSAADVEEHGALTLFVSRIPWRFYGRPRLGLAEDVGPDDVAAVRARQRELGVHEAFEWVHETAPSLAGATVAAGLQVLQVPLLALDEPQWAPPPTPDGIEANLAGCEASAEGTLATATALNPFIGYDKAGEIVKEATASGRSVREIAREHGVEDAVLNKALDLRKIARGNKTR